MLILYFFFLFFSGMKIKSIENNLPESDDVMSFQALMTSKPTCEIFPKQNSKLNLEVAPHPVLPQESITASLNSLLLPEGAYYLNTQKQLMPSPRPSTKEPVKGINKSIVSESTQPNTSSHNVSMIANLHLSTIDWEGTSFSNSPAIQRNTFSHDLQSELESELSTISPGFENTLEQLSCEPKQYTMNNNEVLDGTLQKISPEEHLLSGITDLYLHDLSLKERINKKLFPQNNVQPDVDLKTLSLLRVKELCHVNSSSDYPSHLSEDLPRIHLQNESRNSEILKEDQLLQGNCKVNTSIPYSVNDSIVKTSSAQVGPPSTIFYHSRKVDKQSSKKIVMNSVCLDRCSSDEESAPVHGKAKDPTQKMEHCSQKYNPVLSRDSNHSKFSGPKVHTKETELSVKSHKTAGNGENCFPDPTNSSQRFLQYHKKDCNPGTCLDSPLPLCQRLKLRFQNP
jgi:flap endonuclease GEN